MGFLNDGNVYFPVQVVDGIHGVAGVPAKAIVEWE